MSQLAEQSKLMDPSAPGLFEAIGQVQQGHTITVIVAPESEGQVRVTIYPTAPKTDKAAGISGNEKAGKAGQSKSGGDDEKALPFKAFSFVGRPQEIDQLGDGLAGLFSEMHQSAQTLAQLREQTKADNEAAEKIEKRLRDLAEQRKKNANSPGPLFQEEGGKGDPRSPDAKKKKNELLRGQAPEYHR